MIAKKKSNNIKALENILPEDFIKNHQVSDIECDSRKISSGNLFIAIKGGNFDGNNYIDKAFEKGAVAVISDSIENKDKYVFKVPKIRELLPSIAAEFYNNKPQNLVAVTGTNGKTSICSYLRELWSISGLNAAQIGTIGIIASVKGKDKDLYDGSLTTPDIVSMHKILSEVKYNDIDYVSLEASSHGLDQNRLALIKFRAGVFTNITHDHLDYHKTFENYLQAKLKLFTQLLEPGNFAIINISANYANNFVEASKLRGLKIITYGNPNSDIYIKSFKANEIVISCFGKEYKSKVNIYIDFQLENLLAAVGVYLSLGGNDKILLELDKITSPAGRMEMVAFDKKSQKMIFVDYAHTPDALERALQAARKITKSNLWVLFGCGGDRDKTKRPVMGEIAERLADKIVITDDNPRTEDAAIIRSQILNKCPKALNIADRRDAIKFAVGNLDAGDILLIAGKGHENYQVIGNQKYHFDDKETAKELFYG